MSINTLENKLTLEEMLRECVKRTKDELDSFYEDNFFGLEKDKFYTGYELRTTCHTKAVSALEAYLKYKNEKPCISSRIEHNLLSGEDKAWDELVGALNYEGSGWDLEEYGGLFFLSRNLGGGISVMVEKGGRRFSMECEIVGAFALEINPKDLEAFSKYFNRAE